MNHSQHKTKKANNKNLIAFDYNEIKNQTSLNQEALGDIIGVTRSTFNRYVRDKLIPKDRYDTLLSSIKNEDYIEIEIIPFSAHAKYLADLEEIHGDTEKILLPRSILPNGKYISFRVSGDSMDNRHIDDTKDGTIIVCKKADTIKPSLYGYVIVTHGNILFKDIVSTDENTIRCRSRNTSPEYQDILIPQTQIREIYKVVLRII